MSFVLDLKQAAAVGRSGGAEAGAETEIGIETEIGRGTEIETEGDAIALAPVLDLVLMRGTGESAGAAGTLAADPGVQLAQTETKAQTAGRTNMWTALHQRSHLWLISTMAKSPVSCSLAALCSWKDLGNAGKVWSIFLSLGERVVWQMWQMWSAKVKESKSRCCPSLDPKQV